MATIATDSELGRHLLTIRGFHFIFGAQRDPYALLLRAGNEDTAELGTQVRDRGRLSQSEAMASVTATHAVAAEALNHPLLGLRHVGEPGEQQQHVFQDVWSDPKVCHVLPLDEAFLNMERQDYARLTGLAENVLGTDALEARGAAAERIFTAALGKPAGGFDLMVDFARGAVVEQVCDVLGVPEGKRADVARLSPVLGIALDAGLCPPQLRTARRLIAAVEELRDLFTGVIEARRSSPGDDAISAMLEAAGDGATAVDDVLGVCVLTTVAGVEVTANLICDTVLALLENSPQWRMLCDDPAALAGPAVEEGLRYAPPIRLENRLAQEALDLAGERIEADAQLVVLVDAANRDPEVFTDPDRFDVTRDPGSANLALTGGLYGEFVAPFARTQAAAALRVLAKGVPGLTPAEAVLRRMRSPVVRGVLRLPVTTR
ncbi:P450-derived glycosyltransferase activator [Spirillospora sp. NPDC047279]|uniref:cytochrome P450 family protein n=1 Tax=Spirillospora sp. NPDC047279 TaxID=3155478 RepID=UPI0033C71337